VSAATFKVGDRVATVPGPDFGYSWDWIRYGTVTGHQPFTDMQFVVFDDEDDPVYAEEGWLMRDHEISHIDSKENSMTNNGNIQDKSRDEIQEILNTGSPSDRAEVFIQTLERSGVPVREALKALVLAIDQADASTRAAADTDLSETDQWFFSGVQAVTDGANDFMQYVFRWGVAPEIDAWT